VKEALREISILTHAVAEDAVAALLEREFGQVPSIHADTATGVSTVSVYWQLQPGDIAETKATLRDALEELADDGVDPAPCRVRIRRVPPRDWSESWKRHFKPLVIGARLLVKPTWSRRKPARGQAVVLLDPGLSFGTGQHATTHFCLTQVVACRRETAPQSFLDIGTGSGILAIAAVQVGYSPVNAFDFDPDCVRVATENAQLNGVEERLRPALADITKANRSSREQVDVVCANLIYDLLISERDRILARVKPDGSLVLAGILISQFDAVQRAYAAADWRLVTAKTEKEWRSGLFRRAPAGRSGVAKRKS
jgi:ribosomal protein L11 methyltransferase